MNKRAVLLLSGGIDSATCGAIAKSEGYELYAISFSYGQRHTVELQAASKTAHHLGIKEHLVVNLDPAAFTGSALTDNIDVPKKGISHNTIPVTYVPARNTIFLSFALGRAEVLGAGSIFIGVNAVDYSGYPDCRPEYIEAYQRVANLATKASVEGKAVTIHTPLISLSKAEIISTGVTLGVDYSLTHSCYDPLRDGGACGECDSCIIRRAGFREAGVDDPTRYGS